MVGIEDSSIDGSGRREQLLDIPIVMADTEGGFMINKVVEKRVLVGCDFFKWGVARWGCVMDGWRQNQIMGRIPLSLGANNASI
jgi:hypothetical protein